MRVLVIDDEDSLRGILRAVLIEIGCDAVSFASCGETLQLVRDRSSAPDLILLDLDPPKVVRVRRQLAGLLPHSPIASITGFTMETAFTVLRATQGQRTRREAAADHSAASPGEAE